MQCKVVVGQRQRGHLSVFKGAVAPSNLARTRSRDGVGLDNATLLLWSALPPEAPRIHTKHMVACIALLKLKLGMARPAGHTV